MNKSVLALLVAVPVIAYPAASWVIGGQIESLLTEQYAQLEHNEFVRLVERKTERGIFSSKDTATLEIRPELLGELAENQKPPRFTLHSDIQHGPLPGFAAIGMARAHTELHVDNALIKNLFNNQPPLTVSSQLDFSGAGREQLRSPPVEGQVDGQLQLASGGLQLDIDFNLDQSVWQMQGGVPFFKLRSNDPVQSRIELDKLNLEGTQSRVSAELPDLYTGPIKLTLQTLDMQGVSEAREPVHMQNLRAESDVRHQNGFVDIQVGYAIDDMRVGAQSLKNARFELALRHLQAQALVELDRVSRAQSGGQDANAALKPMLPALQKLLENSPEIAIEQLGVSTPEGDIKASAVVKLPNANVGDLGVAMENPVILMGLASVVEANAQLALPQALLMANLSEEQAEMLPALLQSGYVLNNNGQLSTSISYAQGRVTINGQLIDPGVMTGMGAGN
ncbi:MAG: YdgA family protein [Pseudomonadota bacterium]